jgi:hypothetical protein
MPLNGWSSLAAFVHTSRLLVWSAATKAVCINHREIQGGRKGLTPACKEAQALRR